MRQRKLSPDEEAALMSWYSQYQQALRQLRRLGSIRDKARELEISTRTVHTVVKRVDEKLSRALREMTPQLRAEVIAKRRQSQERKDTAVTLRRAGKTYREISDVLGITPARVQQLVKGVQEPVCV